MSLDKLPLIQIVLTLTGAGTVMWLVHQGARRARLTRFAPLLSSLAGVGVLVGLYALGVPGAGYVLLAMIVLAAAAFLMMMLTSG